MTLVRPPRGTRPANRRALIVAAATELFGTRGYEHVGIGEVAAAVNVGPSALYRHFASKQQLLSEVVHSGIQPILDEIGRLDFADPRPAVQRLAALALDHRRMGVLWQREARHLPAAEYRELRAEVGRVGRSLAERIGAAGIDAPRREREVRAWALVSVLLSPSFHQLALPRVDFEALLARLGTRVLDCPLPRVGPPRPSPPGLLPNSRREAVLAQAIRLFAERSYAGVGIEEIAASLGMAGPSVYNHFDSKIDLLVTALHRGTAYLYLEVSEVLAGTQQPADALRGLIHSYVHFAFRHHDLLDVLITETRNLPDDERPAAVQAQREYIGEWVHLLSTLDPDLDTTTCRVQVQAVLMVVNDAARTWHVRAAEHSADAVAALCERLLGVAPGG